MNESGIKPLGRAVLVEPYEPEKKSSLIIRAENFADREAMLESRAVVIEVGPSCWPNEEPRAKPGDKVILANYAGKLVKGTADDRLYRVVNDADIFAAIVKEKE